MNSEKLPDTITLNGTVYHKEKKQPRGRSLNPTPSLMFYAKAKKAHQDFNRHQRQNNQPELSFELWAWNNNIDLSGRTVVNIENHLF